MRNFHLRGSLMSAAAFVLEAQSWAKALTKSESRFPGDYGPAMRRVAAKAKVPFGLMWALHYRTPKTISVDAYAQLGAYYVEQQRKYRVERNAVAATTPLGRALLRAADRLAGEESEDLT